jgi:phosphoglycerol transferase MdoB-like AlkP superfamily enzyme
VIGDWVRNWFAMNLDQGVSRSYSRSFSESAQKFTNGPDTCNRGSRSRKNVVLVIVESLSSYHSAALEGRGWSPELDRIATHGRLFTNFHANGFTTDMGLIALFTGKAPLPAVGRYGGSRAYDGYFGPDGSLPTVLTANGYDTAFLTTGDLRFLEKGAWIRSIGFGYAEGDDHPFYKDMPRMHFHAAPDAALFDRFIQWRVSRPADRPYFAALLTVSSHPPFLAPDGTRGEEASIRYADSALGRFYDQLVDSHFFDSGVLMILGDHRAMTMVTADERAKFGDRALSRVPLVIVTDPRAPGVRIDSLQQQADVPYSLAAFTGDEVCRPPDRGDFLAEPPIEAKSVIHVRGDQRSWLGVYSANGLDARIRLDGDDTNWIGAAPPNGGPILGWVNKERIALGEVDRDMIDFMLRVHGGR